jgi:hypothetical protein
MPPLPVRLARSRATICPRTPTKSSTAICPYAGLSTRLAEQPLSGPLRSRRTVTGLQADFRRRRDNPRPTNPVPNIAIEPGSGTDVVVDVGV